MKKLLNTLYITSIDAYLSLDGENIAVKKEGSEVQRIPLHNIESIITFGYLGISPALMRKCAVTGVDICFMTTSGKFAARVVGESKGNVLLRKKQYRISDMESDSLAIAKNFIFGKLVNSYNTLSRTIRDNRERVEVPVIENAKSMLKNSISKIAQTKSLSELNGLEGDAARAYFSVFNHMVINQKKDFYFNGRSKRPPLDNINAMLSFLYTLLAKDCTSALEGVGIDAYVGFLHRDRPGRASMALDLMEELRSVFVDRFVITMINRNEIKGMDFLQKESGGVILTDNARKTILERWQIRKKTIITHPYLKEKIEFGLVPHVQALLLARYLREDLDEYPPFFWK